MMLVVEIVEFLRQLKRILCHEGRFLSGNRRVHCVVERARGYQQLPKTVSFCPRKKLTSGFCGHCDVRCASFRALPANSSNPHYCVLAVGPGLALKAQRVFEIEGDDRAASKLQQKKSQRTHCN